MMTIDAMFAETGSRRQHSLARMFSRLWLAYRAYRITRRSRHALLELTDEQLCDIGVSPGEARREIAKSFFWD